MCVVADFSTVRVRETGIVILSYFAITHGWVLPWLYLSSVYG